MRSRIGWLALVPALAACEPPVFGSRIDQGVIAADVVRSTGGAFAVTPEAVFYKNGVLEASLFSSDTCAVDGGLSPAALIDPVEPPTLQTLSAGAFVEWRAAARRDTLVPSFVGGALRYRLLYLTEIPATPGEVVDVVIAGEDGGFEATTIQARLADDVAMDPVIVPPVGSPLVVTWTPSAVPGSKVLIDFSYRVPGGGFLPQTANLRCRFSDTGTGTVPQTVTDIWRAANPSFNTYRAYRERTTVVRLAGRREVYVLSRMQSLPLSSVP